MRTFLGIALVAVTGLGARGAVLPLGLQATDISVTASYTAKAPVDEKHRIFIFLFDHPTPTAGSEPLRMQAISKNGATATFPGITTNPVYVTLVYDEKANYEGTSAPPPGAPIGAYLKNGKPVPVKPGDKVTVSFDASVRWK